MNVQLADLEAAYGELTPEQSEFLAQRQHLIQLLGQARAMIADVFPDSRASLELLDDGRGPEHLCILVHTDLSYMASIPQRTQLQERWRSEFARSVNRELTAMLWFEEKRYGIAPKQRNEND